jgi:hypothetical protein
MRTYRRIVRREAVALRRFRGDGVTRTDIGSGRISDPEAKYSLTPCGSEVFSREGVESASTVGLLRSPAEIEEIIVLTRLSLYNQCVSCGSRAILRRIDDECVRPLPSERTVSRILAKRCLTHGRTGYYPEDYM